jgi:2,3,4,5-tetrahydropyridine-2,6-dicarboxylate N-succinyltransferase
MNIFPLIAVGSGSMNNNGDLLDVRYQVIVTQKNEELHNPLGFAYENYSDLEAMLKDSPEGHSLKENFEKELSINKNKRLVILQINKDESVKNICDAYLKLYLLSLRIAKPNSLNLDGIFANLPNNAWTNFGPIDPEELDAFRLEHENTYVKSVDKFPCMTDYIVPNGVRIADGSRIRLGAYLAEGTTIMHEGFVNFNAGTLGTAMIEGRISAGVVIGKNSDLGGGCSTMGTLSGGNDIRISVGEDCLLGANSGLGIPLGDRCIVEAGLYLTGGSRVEVLNAKGELIEVTKAANLSSKSDLLFIRNSLTGSIQCKPNHKNVQLNETLHNND